METDCGVWVRGKIVEELLASLHSLLRAFRLFARYGTEGHEDGEVDRSIIVKYAPNDPLHLLLFFFRKRGRCVGFDWPLCFAAVLFRLGGKGTILGFRR